MSGSRVVEPRWTARTILLVMLPIAACGWLVSLGRHDHSYSAWEIVYDGKRTVLPTDDAFCEYTCDDWNGDGSWVDFGICREVDPVIAADPETIHSRWAGNPGDYVFTRMPDTAEAREKVSGQLPNVPPDNGEWHSSLPDSGLLMPALVKRLQHDHAVRCYECRVNEYSLAYLLFIPGPANGPGEFVVISSQW
jgi:hypothetical protein